MKKDAIILLSLGFALTLVGVIGALSPLYLNRTLTLGYSPLKTFSSYDELKNFLETSSQVQPHYEYYTFMTSQRLAPFTLSLSGATEDYADPTDFSTTNIQVEGVDEADIVKTDGEYIYLITNNTVLIIKAYPPEQAEIISKIKFNGTLTDMYVNKDRLVVFEQRSFSEPSTNTYTPTAFIKVYDIADRTNPTLVRNISLEGNYANSRMIGKYVYAIINQRAYIQEYNKPIKVTLPVIQIDEKTETIPATQIYYSNTTDQFTTLTHVLAINILNNQQDPTHKSFLIGITNTLYVSPSNIYLTYPQWSETDQTTSIHRIHIQDEEITYTATGAVPGYVLNQFSMDEHNSYLRIATTTGQLSRTGIDTSQNHVYILNPDLDITGELEDLAPGERIYSARFMGNRAYLVTFKKIDPLFVLDLTNPFNPKVLGQLKITGYSDYLHPYDENHIIGIGKETIEAEEGNFAWYQGVKISLFDVTDVYTPKEIDKYEIGDRGTASPILYDHKAFLFDREKNLLVIPVTVAEINPAKYPGGEIPPNAYGDYVWDGAYVFNISLEQGIELKGQITHLDNNLDLIKSGHYYNSQYSVKRSLYIDNVLYTISNLRIKMNSLSDMNEINEIELSD